MLFMDISHADDGLLVMEGVNMGTKVLNKMANDSSIIVGFECEFKIRDEVLATLQSASWFDEHRIDLGYVSVEEMEAHPKWDDNKFGLAYDDWYGKAADELKDMKWDDYLADAHWDVVEKYTEKYRAEGEKWWEKEGKNQKHSVMTGRDPKKQYIQDIVSEYVTDDHEEEVEEIAFKEWEAFTEKESKGFGQLSKDTFFSGDRIAVFRLLDIDAGQDDEEATVSLTQLQNLGQKFTDEYGHKFLDIQVGYNSAERDKFSWSLETDPSIDGHPEVISPATKIDIALKNINDMLEFVTKYGYTDESCGFHVSLNIDGKEADDYDLLKLGLFLGEKYILDKFGRSNSTFTQPQMDAVAYAAQNHDSFLTPSEMMKVVGGDYEGAVRDDDYGDDLNDKTVTALAKAYERTEKAIFNDPMFTARYRTFNVSNLKSKGYIEFRVMGGKDYHTKFDEITKTILRYAYVLKLSATPDMEQKEYQKKLFRLFDAISKQEKKPASNSRSEKHKRKQEFDKVWVDVKHPFPFHAETPVTTINYGIKDAFKTGYTNGELAFNVSESLVMYCVGIFILDKTNKATLTDHTKMMNHLLDMAPYVGNREHFIKKASTTNISDPWGDFNLDGFSTDVNKVSGDAFDAIRKEK